MEIHDYVHALRRGWLLLLLLAALGALIGGVASRTITPQYSADAKAYVSTQSTTSVGDLSTGAAYAEQVIASFADIATTEAVLGPVRSRLHLSQSVAQLSKVVTVVPATDEAVLDVTVTDTSPTRAAAIANAVVSQLATTVDDLSLRAEGVKAPVAIKLVNPAVAAASPEFPKPALFIGLGLFAGIVVAFAAAVLREVLDTRIRTVEDSRRAVDLAVLGVVNGDRRNARRPLIPTAVRDAMWSEPYRSLRNNIRFMELGAEKRSVVITSALAGEGKTTSVVNLGLALADLGERVLLVDADLRRPQLAARFGLDGSVGLSDVLIGAATIDDAMQAWGEAGVTVLPSGQVPPNPNELLQSAQMSALLADLGERFDTILFDAPPIGSVSDAAVLGRSVTGTLLVAASGQVRRAQLADAHTELSQAGVRVLGIVLTKVPRASKPDYYASLPPGTKPTLGTTKAIPAGSGERLAMAASSAS